jgi:putative membrane-bound dehydrogenase-like protein
VKIESAFVNPQSMILNLRRGICNPQSAFRIRHSPIRIRHSTFGVRHSAIRNPQSATRNRLCFLLSAFCLLLFACSRNRGPGSLSPQQSLKTFQLADPNLRAEIFAAEPDVVDPVEIVFDEDGRVFAAEMRDYPADPPAGQPPKSRIRLLEDTDGDGKIDRSTIFADNLLEVTSMLPWKGGLIVTAAPDILYLKDTNGDGKADIRKVLFTGFALVNPETRITNLRFGIDNWIYAANNGQRGDITFPGRSLLLNSEEVGKREGGRGRVGERENLDRDSSRLQSAEGGARKVESSQHPTSVNVLGADFRFRLDRGLFEAESGPTQFGLAMDDWGHRFITENTVHIRHVVMPRRYLLRNPFLPAGVAAEDISDHGRPSARMFQLTPPQYWRQVRTAMRQQRYQENNLSRKEIVAGYFTAASGGTIYSGDGLPAQYYGTLFTGDVSGNLVHRDVLRPAGASFVASRASNELDKEFLASTDPWFRPCSFATGPDGNLYIVDMYREFIETPESIPEELKKDMDFYSGTTLGRIYRIAPKAPQRAAAKPHLSTVPSSELVSLLAHRNGWWRLTAQRLLLERQDKSVVPALRKMTSESDFAQARLHALYALEGLSSLDAALVEKTLEDPEAGVREHALRLAEAYNGHISSEGLKESEPRPSGSGPSDESPRLWATGSGAGRDGLVAKLVGMIHDPSSNVRFQLALSLGAFVGGDKSPAGSAGLKRRNRDILKALATLANEQSEDSWFRTAVLSSVGQPVTLPVSEQVKQLNALVDLLAEQEFFQKPSPGKQRLLEQLALGIGVRNEAAGIVHFLNLLSHLQLPSSATADQASSKQIAEVWQVAGLSGMARGLKLAEARRLKVPAAESQLSRFLASPSEKVQSAARAAARHFEMEALIASSMKQALDAGIPGANRKAAIQSLASGEFREVRPVFEKILSSQPSQELVGAAVASLSSMDDPGVAELLIARWNKFSPQIREQALDVLLNHRQRVPVLLQAVGNGRIEKNALDLPRKQKLLLNPDPQIAAKARELFKEGASDRAQVVASCRSALTLTGDATKGRAVFEKSCGQCHLPQKGRRIGPDLSGVSSQTKEQLLQNILDPSREIQARFTNYIVTTKDGRIHDGLIVSETPGSITLRPSAGEDETLLRANINEIRASSVSLMPDGLEQNMSKQDLADVIAFLQGANLHHHHGP